MDEAPPLPLSSFGTDLTALAKAGSLPRAYGRASLRASLVAALRREPRRSIALLGASGTGKTALVQELAYELAQAEDVSWRVIRVSPTDLIAGTKYSGEWETKVRALVDAVRRSPHRVVVYVPNLSDLSTAGTWSRSNSSIATAMAPYLEDGSVLMLGESTPEEFERGLGRIPSLQRLFERVLVEETSLDETREILAAVRDESLMPASNTVLNHVLEVSSQFLSHMSRPGNAVTLLRTVAQTAKQAEIRVTVRDVLETLSKSSGVPADLLDDSVSLNLPAVRAFFESRIIGQSEAVGAMVDMVTLIKAGLTDPQKPCGVFLFVGPTGVGKTELARALASFIFGDASRLKRFDMSEFASSDGFMKLIGTSYENGLLTDAVRQNPFSVVLLDEIEKGHLNVFDLCLQIFDAGRLTDGRGRTVDFRRTIVILTSNIGAGLGPAPAMMGFGAVPPLVSADADRTFRELSRFFRPEFLNRLDRIVQFAPLSPEVAEQIARREIDLALKRAGITRRSLTIDVSPSAVALLVREGYSPHFGARPLKRTVERMLLLPVARFIATGTVNHHAIIHIREKAGRLEITATSRETAPTPVEPRPKRDADPLTQRVDELLERFQATDAEVAPLADKKSELLLRTQQPGFYDDPAGRASTFDKIHQLDHLLSTWNGLSRALTGLHTRLQRPVVKSDESAVRETCDRLAAELDHLAGLVTTGNSEDLDEAIVALSVVERIGVPQDGIQALAGMYQALAARRRMKAEVLGEIVVGKDDAAWLHIAGLGAYALLKGEAGLHQLDRRAKDRKKDREVLRVDVWPVGAESDDVFRRGLKSKIAALKPARHRLLKADTAVSLFHEPTLRSVAMWTGGPRQPALDRATMVLHAQVAASAAEVDRGDAGMVRYYELGTGGRVRDARSGHSTSDIGRVLKGDLRIPT